MTAKTDEVDRVVGFELGADDYVTKPFSVRELVLRVKAILKRGAVETPSDDSSSHNFGGLELNLEAHQVFIDSKEVVLTALEFRLLKHLLDRRGRVQTRDQLLGDVGVIVLKVTTRTVDTSYQETSRKIRSRWSIIFKPFEVLGIVFPEIQISINEHKRKVYFYCNVLFITGTNIRFYCC